MMHLGMAYNAAESVSLCKFCRLVHKRLKCDLLTYHTFWDLLFTQFLRGYAHWDSKVALGEDTTDEALRFYYILIFKDNVMFAPKKLDRRTNKIRPHCYE